MGFGVGSGVGSTDGIGVGSGVGSTDGIGVGSGVGSTDGIGVGSGVGSHLYSVGHSVGSTEDLGQLSLTVGCSVTVGTGHNVGRFLRGNEIGVSRDGGRKTIGTLVGPFKSGVLVGTYGTCEFRFLIAGSSVGMGLSV